MNKHIFIEEPEGEFCELKLTYEELTKMYYKIDKLQQELQRKDNNWNELKEYIGRFLYMLNGILDRDIYEQCQLDDFTQIMDKINELEGDNK